MFLMYYVSYKFASNGMPTSSFPSRSLRTGTELVLVFFTAALQSPNPLHEGFLYSRQLPYTTRKYALTGPSLQRHFASVRLGPLTSMATPAYYSTPTYQISKLTHVKQARHDCKHRRSHRRTYFFMTCRSLERTKAAPLALTGR